MSIISLKLESAWQASDLKDNLTLKYQIPSAGKYQVMVHSPDHHYKMLRSGSFYDRFVTLPPGPSTFSWDARIIKLLDVMPTELFCLISKTDGDSQLVPAILAPASRPNNVIPSSYSVTVLPNTDVREIKLMVIRPDATLVFTSDAFTGLPRDTAFNFLVPIEHLVPGAYKLSFHVTFEPSGQSHTVEKSFHHSVLQ